VDQLRSSRDTVRKIQDELLAALRETDQLSLFYGVISRKDYRLRYVNLGSSCAFYAPSGGDFRQLESQGEALSRSKRFSPEGVEGVIEMEPEDRLALISDGFVEAVGGPGPLIELLNKFRKKDPKETLNELAYRVKSTLTDADDLPAQDCTALLLDVDTRVIRLARN
jgi:serine phosphatase RsbU (regulator of sigma subunit)